MPYEGRVSCTLNKRLMPCEWNLRVRLRNLGLGLLDHLHQSFQLVALAFRIAREANSRKSQCIQLGRS